MQDNLVTPFANSLEKSFNALMELNINTVQRLFFTNQEELMNIRRPEELLGKTFGIMVENGQKNMEYIQDFFQIFESHMLHVSLNDTKKTVKQMSRTLAPITSVTIPVATVNRPKKAKPKSMSSQKKVTAVKMSATQKSGEKSHKTTARKNTNSSTKMNITKPGTKSKITIKK